VSLPLGAFGRHALLLGASGSGKTTLAHRIREALIEAGVSVVEIDFRGDGFDRALLRAVASGFPEERLRAIDLRERGRVFPMNFLGHGAGDPHSRASVVYGALRENAESWGVQLGPDLRAALVALAEMRGSLLDVPPLLAPEGGAFRQELVGQVRDAYASEFLISYDALAPDVQRTRGAAVANKLDEYLHHPALRLALGASGAPDLRSMMDEPGTLTLIALGADRMPQARLVGRMVVSAIQRSAMARVDVPEARRNPVRLIVDEAQNVLGEETCEILAEGRRFRLGILAATQFAGNFPPRLRSALRVNASVQFYFQTSADEAADLSREIVSSLSREEVRRTLLTAPVGTAVLVRRGEPAALVRTDDSADPVVDEQVVADVKAVAMEKGGVPAAQAEGEISESWRARSTAQATPQIEVRHYRRPKGSRADA
jgi:DNA helicase HerA-like ATPase